VSTGGVSTIPNAVLATDKERLQVEATGRASVVAAQAGTPSAIGTSVLAGPNFLRGVTATGAVQPLPAAVREQALQQIDKQLVAAGLIDKVGGSVKADVVKQFSFELTFSLPTPGILVKGCLDECDICEPEVKRAIELELKRKELENKLLARQIELLEKSQEYRCCPEGSAEQPTTP
jgi:hypothetical protein